MDRRKSIPLKSAESSMLLKSRRTLTLDLTPIKHSAPAEPWTPTANLKVLIRAASSDIRDREMKKVLFRPLENDKENPGSPDGSVEDPELEDLCQVPEGPALLLDLLIFLEEKYMLLLVTW